MLSIRLTRYGRRNRPFYRVVVADSRRSRDGRFIEVVGHYDPVLKPAAINLDTDKINDWVSKGAKLSETVGSLLKQVKVKERIETGTGTAAGVQQEVKE
jgi:small subunit ribosomal protein S16